jgi:uncharacterized membrane protein
MNKALTGVLKVKALLVILFVTGILGVSWTEVYRSSIENGNASAAPEFLKAKDGAVSIPLSALDGGVVKLYIYRLPDASVRFFLVKVPDGAIRAAFDACAVCYRANKGYQQSGDRVTCLNCGNQFMIKSLGQDKRGCNPVKLPSRIDGDSVRIRASDLKAGEAYFNF